MSIRLEDQRDIVYDGKDFRQAKSDAIHLVNCDNVTIKNCVFEDIDGCAIRLTRCRNCIVESCVFERSAYGVRASDCINTTVIDCNFVDIHHKVQGPAQSSAILFHNSSGGEIGNNWIQTDSDVCRDKVGDLICLYACKRIGSVHVYVHDNHIIGGGTNPSACGISVDGECDGIRIHRNKLDSCGSYGIGVTSGSNIAITHNCVYSAQTCVSNTGIFVKRTKQTYAMMHAISITDNRVFWVSSTGFSTPLCDDDKRNGTTVVYGRNQWMHDWRNDPDILREADDFCRLDDVADDEDVYMVWRIRPDGEAVVTYYGNIKPTIED